MGLIGHTNGSIFVRITASRILYLRVVCGYHRKISQQGPNPVNFFHFITLSDRITMTHGHSHAVVLLVGTAAAEESDDEDDASDHNEQNRRRVEARPEEVKVHLELGLYQSSGDDQSQARQLENTQHI